MATKQTSEYQLLSFPLKRRESPLLDPDVIEDDKAELLRDLSLKLSSGSQPLCEIFPLPIPDLKVGTLDNLVSAGEDMSKLDPQFEMIVEKLIGHLKVLVEGDKEKLKSSLVVEELTCDAYVKRFQWNLLKYRIDIPIAEIVETLLQEIQQIDNLVRAKMHSYQQTRTTLSALAKKQTGSLLSRDLASLVKKDDFLGESEFMSTLFVVVPKFLKEEWLAEYEKLSDLVVPRSSKLIAEEADQLLFSVIVFNKAKKAFSEAAAHKRFTVREYVFDEEVQAVQKDEETRLNADIQAQWANLMRLLRTNFGEAFSCWMHLKAVRLYVESLLRYGLPPSFLFLLVRPLKGPSKLRKAILSELDQLSLPGISQIDLATAMHSEGMMPGGMAHLKDQQSSKSADPQTDAQEAAIWNALNVSMHNQFEPFVRLDLKWTI